MIKINTDNETKLTSNIIGVFFIKKLGKSGFFSKERILVINELCVAYYRMPKETNNTSTIYN